MITDSSSKTIQSKNESKEDEKLQDRGNQIQEKKHLDANENVIIKEDYLMRQSVYLKKLKKRYAVLHEENLLCFKDDDKTSTPIETILMSSVAKAQLSQKDIARFELLLNTNKDKVIVFAAESMIEAEKWVNTINDIIVPEKEPVALENQVDDQKIQRGILNYVLHPTLTI